MSFRSSGRLRCWFPVVLLLTVILGNATAQSLPSFAPQSRSNFQSQPLSPFNPLSAPGSANGPVGSDVIPLSSGMLRGLLPTIPNLELGFLYNFGSNIRSGRFYADYLYPLNLSANSVLFGEAHYESQDFWKKPAGGSDYRQDLSLGGGFRRILSDRSFLGINAFYDGTKLFGKWYSSAGLGLEMVAITPGEGAIDLNVNWYGNLINKSQLINAFRNQAGSWDIEAGVSQPLFDQALDLRLKAAGYDFNIGTAVYGWRVGADLTTRNGVFTVKYEHGQDRINGAYNTIGGYVNVGLQLENVTSGESPFMMPEPVFGSPRHLWRLLTQKVRRNWHQPAAVVLANGSGGPRRLVLVDMFLSSYWPPSATFAPDIPNNSWTLTSSTTCVQARLHYIVKVSDDSLTDLEGQITPSEYLGFASRWMFWGQTAPTRSMTSSPQDVALLWAPHEVSLSVDGSQNGTVIISSTDPSIAPLIITYRLTATSFCP
jgi:hypothetical protein